MAVPIEQLNDLANSLRIILSAPPVIPPGQLVTATLAPPVSGLKATDILSGAIDLTFIAKNVRFAEAGLEPSLEPSDLTENPATGPILGSMPARVPLVGTLTGTEELAGVPGYLAQLAGALPVPAETAISIQVEWTVRDANGNVLAEGDQFLAPAGMTAPDLPLVFAPVLVELSSSDVAPAPVERRIHARVKLAAGGVETDWIELPEVPVFVVAVGLPTVLALFRHSDFAPRHNNSEGAVLIIVPANSPLRSLADLQPVLNDLESIASSLTGFARFVSFLLGVQILKSALAAQPHVQFRASNQIANLNNIDVIKRPWYKNDIEAEDELSSLIFIGTPAKHVQCFNGRKFSDKEGQMNVTIGRRIAGASQQCGPEMFTLVRSLHDAQPQSEPTGEEIEIVRAPAGRALRPPRKITTFGDELSSLRFQETQCPPPPALPPIE